MTKKILIAIVIIAVIIGVAFALTRNTPTEDLQSAADPKTVVARVNGEEITRGELDNQIAQIEQSSQVQIPEEDAEARNAQERTALDHLIDAKIFLLAARDKGFDVTPDEVQSELGRIIDQFESPEAFQAQLSVAGIPEAKLREEISNQLTINKYYNQLVAENEVTVSDEEVKTIYDAQVAPQENAPTLEEIAPQIKSQLEQQKMQVIIAQIITALRIDANIEILL